MVSNTLHNDIQEGDLVEVSFPVGEFNLPEGDGSLCLLSAGIGITPLFAMLKEAVKKDPTRKISFVHVCKSKKAVPFSDEIDLLVKEGTVTFEVFETSAHGVVLLKNSSSTWQTKTLISVFAVLFPS